MSYPICSPVFLPGRDAGDANAASPDPWAVRGERQIRQAMRLPYN
jgi:hypothetical protein